MTVCIYKVHVSDEQFFPWQLFPWQRFLGRQIPSLNNAVCHSKQSMKKWNQIHQVYSRKIATEVYLVLLLRSQTLVKGSKIRQIFVGFF